MVWVEFFVAEADAVERDGGDLIKTDGKPGLAGAYEIAVDAGGMDQRNERGVTDAADKAVLQVVYRETEQFREIEEIFRHREIPAVPRLA